MFWIQKADIMCWYSGYLNDWEQDGTPSRIKTNANSNLMFATVCEADEAAFIPDFPVKLILFLHLFLVYWQHLNMFTKIQHVRLQTGIEWYLIVIERTTLTVDRDTVKPEPHSLIFIKGNQLQTQLQPLVTSTDLCGIFAKEHVIWIVPTNLFESHNKQLLKVWLTYLTIDMQYAQTTTFTTRPPQTNKLQAQWSLAKHMGRPTW